MGGSRNGDLKLGLADQLRCGSDGAKASLHAESVLRRALTGEPINR